MAPPPTPRLVLPVFSCCCCLAAAAPLSGGDTVRGCCSQVASAAEETAALARDWVHRIREAAAACEHAPRAPGLPSSDAASIECCPLSRMISPGTSGGMPGWYSLLFPLPVPPAFFRLLLVSSLGAVGLCPAGRGSRELAEMVEQAGPMPSTTDPERLSFWVSHTKGGTARPRLTPWAMQKDDAGCATRTTAGCGPSSFGLVLFFIRSDGGRGGCRGAGGQLAAGGPAGAPGHAAYH